MDKPQIVLPGDLYDGLQLSALAFGGIGCGRFYDKLGDPCCVFGMANFGPELNHPGARLFEAGITTCEDSDTHRGNDTAVRAINIRKGANQGARVTFEEWCAELNVVPDYAL